MKSTVISALLILPLAGCGGGGGGGSANGDSDSGDNGSGTGSVIAQTDLTGSYQYFGYVEIIQDDVQDRVNRDSNFLQLTESQDASVFRNSVPMIVDTCKLSITTAIPTDVGVIGFPDANFNFVSAGDSYTLTSDAGTYATIDKSESRFEVAPYPVPTPLTLDIPGEQFPAFTNVPVPDVVSVQDFRPRNNETLEADSVISWTPTGLPDHTINLVAFDIVPSGQVVDLRCHVADDGSFSLPTEVINTLNASIGAGFALEDMQQDRRSDSLIISGDALLLVTKTLQIF